MVNELIVNDLFEDFGKDTEERDRAKIGGGESVWILEGEGLRNFSIRMRRWRC